MYIKKVVYTAAANIEDIPVSFTLLHTKYLSEALTERECIQLKTFASASMTSTYMCVRVADG